MVESTLGLFAVQEEVVSHKGSDIARLLSISLGDYLEDNP